jgi:hypothetical protein
MLACAPAPQPEQASIATAQAGLGTTASGWRQVQLLGALHGSTIASMGAKVVLFGGQYGQEWTDQTWEWDGARWTRRWPAAAPPPRPGYTAASVDGRVWLLGGSQLDDGTWADEIWEWDGETWTARPEARPPELGVMIVGLPGGGALAYGGFPSPEENPVGRTWLWDGASWTEAITSAHPAFLTYALLPLGSTVVRLGPDGTWEWDGSDWRLLSATTHLGPTVAAGSTLAIPHEDVTWVWDGAEWHEEHLVPQPRSASAVASGAGLGLLLDEDLATWSWDGARWTQLAARQSPPRRDYPLLFSAGGEVLMFNKDGWPDPSEVWGWNGTRWRSLDATTAIEPWRLELIGAASQTEVIAFGGTTGVGKLNDTWRWGPEGWRQLAPENSPPASRDHGMAGLLATVVLFSPSLGTWTWDGVNWMQNSPSQSPPGWRWVVTAGARVLLGDGSWTWSWDGSQWSQVAPVPFGRCAASSFRERAILFCEGGATYEWTGTAWVEKSVQAETDVLADFSMAAQGSRVVLFSGSRCTPYTDKTWEYLEALANGAPCAAADDCLSGFCADGVCCNKPCTGQCEACALPGVAGACAPVTGDPVGRKACPAGNSLCGPSACDGITTATCTYHAVPCQPEHCSDGEAVLASYCDEKGACPAQQRKPCAPYGCIGGRCLEACAADSDCASGRYCADGVCVAQWPKGRNCARARQCASGFCVDFRCCDVACTGPCESCDLPSLAGLCSPVSGAPLNRPSCGPGGPCGARCDGTHREACSFPVGDPCAPATCAGGTPSEEGACDLTGRCVGLRCPAADAGTGADVGSAASPAEEGGCHCSSGSGASFAWALLGFAVSLPGLTRRRAAARRRGVA